ncbi:hypothetical protein KCU92_g1053, partial [Aureobasidium melanogenum]
MPTTRQNYTDRTAPSREYQTVQNQSVKTTAVWQNIETRLAGLNPHSKARLSDTGYDPEEHRQVKLKFKIVSEKQQTTKQLVERHERNQGEIQKCYSLLDNFERTAESTQYDQNVLQTQLMRMTVLKFLATTRKFSSDQEREFIKKFQFNVEQIAMKFSPSSYQVVLLAKHKASKKSYSLEDLYAVIETVDEDLVRTENELESKQEQLSEVSSEKSELQRKLGTAEEAQLLAQQSLDTANSEHANAVQGYKGEIEDLKKDHSNELERLESAHADTVDKLQKEVSQLEAEVSRKQTAIEHATNDKNTLEEEKKALVDTCEGLRKQIESDKIQSDKDLRAALTREQQSHSSTATSLRKAEQEVAGFKEQLQGVRHELELAKITTTGHEQDLETKDREISSKEEQLSEKQEQIKQLRDIELAEMRRQYNQVSTEKAILVNRATAEHTELSSKHRDSQTRVAELTFDVATLKAQLRDQETLTNDAESRNQTLQGSLNTANNEKSSALETSDLLSVRFNHMRQYMQSELGRNIPEESTLISELVELTQSRMIATHQPSIINVQDVEQQKQIRDLNSTRITQELQLSSNAQRIKTLTEERDVKNRSAIFFEERSKAVEKTNKGLKGQLGLLRLTSARETEELQEQVRNWESQYRQAAEENAGLSTRNDELVVSVGDAESRINELEDQQKKQQEELSAKKGELEDLQKVASETADNLHNQQQDYDRLKQEHDTLKSQAEEIAFRCNTTSDQLNEAQKSLRKTQDDLEALRTQHETLRLTSNEKFRRQAVANNNNFTAKQTSDRELAVLRPRVQEQRKHIERLEEEKLRWQEHERQYQVRIDNLSGDEASLHFKLAEADEEQERLRGELHTHQKSQVEMRNNMDTCQNALASIVNEVRNALVRTPLKREPPRVNLNALLNYDVPRSTIRVLEAYEDLPEALSWSLHNTPSGMLTSIPSQTFEHITSTLRFILFTAPDSAMCAAIIECINVKINLDEADETGLRNLIAAVRISLDCALPTSIVQALNEARTIEAVLRACHSLTVDYDEIGVLVDLWLQKLPGGAENDFLLQAYGTWFSAFTNTGITQTESLVDIISGLNLAPEISEVLPDDSVAHPRYLVVLGATCALVDVQSMAVHMLQLENLRYNSNKRIISFDVSHGGSRTLTGRQFFDFFVGFSRDNSDFIWDNLRALLG